MDKKFPIVHANEHPVFTYVEFEENKVQICVGNNIMSSKVFKDLKAAKQYVGTKPWELIINLSALVAKNIQKDETK